MSLDDIVDEYVGKKADAAAKDKPATTRLPPRSARAVVARPVIVQSPPPAEPAIPIAETPAGLELQALLAPAPAPALKLVPPPRPELRLPIGLHLDVDHDDYIRDPGERPSLSSSIAGILAEKTAYRAWHAHPRLGAPENRRGTGAADKGTVLHKLLLGRGQNIAVVDADDFKTKIAKQERDQAIADGKIPIVTHRYEGLVELADHLRKRLALRGISLAGGESEVTALWERDGVLCRARFDHWAPDELVIDDIKTTTDASPEAVSKKIYEFGYDIQATAYVEAMETLYPELAGRVRMRFLFLEANDDDPANDACVFEPDGTMRELGRKRWKRAREIWKSCLAAGVEETHWPSYPMSLVRIGPPAWAVTKDSEIAFNRLETNDVKPF